MDRLSYGAYVQTSYTITALYGSSFCVASRQSFEILLDHITTYAVIDYVGDFTLLLMKLIIAGGSVLCGTFYINISTCRGPAIPMFAL